MWEFVCGFGLKKQFVDVNVGSVFLIVSLLTYTLCLLNNIILKKVVQHLNGTGWSAEKRKILPGAASTVIWSSSISMCYYNLTALIVPLRLCSSRRPKKKKKKVFPMLFCWPTIVLHRVSTFPYAGSFFCFSYSGLLFLSSCTLLAGQLLSGASCHRPSFFLL